MSTKKKPARKTSQLAIDWGPCTAGWWCHGNGRATSVTFGSEPNYRLCDGCREQALEGTAPFAVACDGPKEQIQLYARVRATPKGVVPCVQDEYRRMKREQYEGPDARMLREVHEHTVRKPRQPQKPRKKRAAPALATAFGVLKVHPEWTVTRIADHVGCTREYLSRNPDFQGARKLLRAPRDLAPEAKARLRRKGRRT
jgi:hypothetical protein